MVRAHPMEGPPDGAEHSAGQTRTKTPEIYSGSSDQIRATLIKCIIEVQMLRGLLKGSGPPPYQADTAPSCGALGHVPAPPVQSKCISPCAEASASSEALSPDLGQRPSTLFFVANPTFKPAVKKSDDWGNWVSAGTDGVAASSPATRHSFTPSPSPSTASPGADSTCAPWRQALQRDSVSRTLKTSRPRRTPHSPNPRRQQHSSQATQAPPSACSIGHSMPSTPGTPTETSSLLPQVNQQSLGVQRSARSLEPSMLRSQQQHSSATTLHALHLHPLNAGAQGRGAAGMSFAAVARGASGMPPLGRQSVGNSTTPRQENGTTPRQSLDRMSVSSVALSWGVKGVSTGGQGGAGGIAVGRSNSFSSSANPAWGAHGGLFRGTITPAGSGIQGGGRRSEGGGRSPPDSAAAKLRGAVGGAAGRMTNATRTMANNMKQAAVKAVKMLGPSPTPLGPHNGRNSNTAASAAAALALRGGSFSGPEGGKGASFNGPEGAKGAIFSGQGGGGRVQLISGWAAQNA